MDALGALRLQLEWGADEALMEQPVDRLAPPRQAVPPARPAAVAAAAVLDPAAQAQALAAGCDTPASLEAALADFGGLSLAATATHMAWMDGAPQAELVFVGDAPDDRDDTSGHAFSGPAGALLDRMLASIRLGRGQALLVQLVPWRPPGGRAPSEAEIAACLPFLQRLLALCGPRHVVALGAAPARALLQRRDPISRLRGRWTEAAVPGLERPVQLLPTLHPAQLLARPEQKPLAWADWRLLRRSLDQSNNS